MGLTEILRLQQPLLDQLFGEGTYQIDTGQPLLARVRTDWMELSLVYDCRDQFVSSAVKPLKVPAEVAEDHSSDTLLRFCDIAVEGRRKSALDERQVTDELTLIGPLVELLKDEQRSRDAAWFVRGYNAALTSWASGEWD